MREIDAANATDYLRGTGRVGPHESLQVRALSGGVSNQVLFVQRATGTDWVLKQARSRLRVAEPWFCGVERIWREVEVLAACQQLLEGPGGLGTADAGVPELVFEDRENYLFVMSAVGPHRVWKAELLEGVAEPRVAATAARLLACLHGRSWNDSQLRNRLADRQFFELLRVDPYYRHVARQDDSLAGPLERLIDSLGQHPCGLVHGDFSPKNLLRTADALILVDHEVGHFGDVAFDVGFFLTHLVLKTFRAGPDWPRYLELPRQFWRAYRQELSRWVSGPELESVEARGLWHLAGCGLARLDGKSPVEYLPEAELRERIRNLFRSALCDPPRCWEDWEPELIARLGPARGSAFA